MFQANPDAQKSCRNSRRFGALPLCHSKPRLQGSRLPSGLRRTSYPFGPSQPSAVDLPVAQQSALGLTVDTSLMLLDTRASASVFGRHKPMRNPPFDAARTTPLWEFVRSKHQSNGRLLFPTHIGVDRRLRSPRLRLSLDEFLAHRPVDHCFTSASQC